MKKKMKKVLALMLVLVLMIPLMTSCKKKTEETESEPKESSAAYVVEEISSEPEEESSEKPVEESAEEVEVIYYNPFTHEVVEEDMSAKRPYVCMVNNLYRAVPHCGVSQSDMIMEMMDESGITRFMVFFFHPEEVEKIGSIRSARIYNVETTIAYDAILVHCGGSSEATHAIRDYDVDDVDGIYLDGDVFYRDPSRQTYGIEHSMFAKGIDLVEAAEVRYEYRTEHEEGYDCTYGLNFDENAAIQCKEDATEITVTYAGGKTTSFSYDKDNNVYYMYQYEDEYSDDGEYGIGFANVIDMYAESWLQSDGIHLAIDFDADGYGTYFTGGKAVSILWYRDDMHDTFHFTLEDGTPLNLAPGKTFVCVNQCGDYGYNGYNEYE